MVIVGGGYIGLEVAAVMRREGRDATVIEAEDRVMKRVTGAAVSDFFDRLHRSRGVDIRLGTRLAAMEGEERATACASPPANDRRPTWCWSRPARAPMTILRRPRACLRGRCCG